MCLCERLMMRKLKTQTASADVSCRRLPEWKHRYLHFCIYKLQSSKLQETTALNISLPEMNGNKYQTFIQYSHTQQYLTSLVIQKEDNCFACKYLFSYYHTNFMFFYFFTFHFDLVLKTQNKLSKSGNILKY